jgi:Fic family protein
LRSLGGYEERQKMTDNPTGIEPTAVERFSPRLVELIAEVTRASTLLGNALHPETALSLAELVRMMNCYYSNQIEGHDTKPREIEEGLASAEVAPGPRRHLLLEAKAHVQVQRAIDELALRGGLGEPATGPFVQRLHRDFYQGADRELLTIGEGDKSFIMTPGEWRTVEVEVGRHVPPGAAAIPAFIAHFERKYAVGGLPLAQQLVAFASAHHRFNFIHPLPDGNGRVSRLMTHAMGHAIGVGAHGLWSISRGLARGRTLGLEGRKEYLQMMQLADAPRE